MTRDAFVRQFGSVFGHAPWVAHEAWAAGPFADADALHAAMVAVTRRARRDRRLELLRSQPGLAALSDACRAELFALDAEYRARFGFPFVVCARGQTAASILAAARERVASDDPGMEERTALAEVAKIARLRLAELIA